MTSTLSRAHGRILKRLTEKEDRVSEEQSLFCGERTCTDSVFCLKQLTEKNVNRNQETQLIFTKLMTPYPSPSYGQCSKKQTLINALRNLYDESRPQMKLRNDLSEQFQELKARVFVKDIESLLPFLKYMSQNHYKRGKGTAKEWE